MMKARLAALWFRIRFSYWFVPTLMTVAAVALAIGTVTLDRTMRPLEGISLFYTGGPEGARTMLSMVSGAMITVAGVVFSITIVALTLTSSQFGPRLLVSFMHDTGNQVVLGVFVATFVYGLLVLRVVRGGDEGMAFVPQVSVAVATALAVSSVGVLIYFIHHVSTSIQAENVIAAVRRDLDRTIDTFFGAQGHAAHDPGEEAGTAAFPRDFEIEARVVPAATSGYVTTLDEAALIAIACEHDLIVRLAHRPGDFVVAGGALALAWPRERADDAVVGGLRRNFVLDQQRTPTQDVEYAINQLVEVAVRALSPGINDPFTAMTCVDWLGAALCRLAERDIPSPYRWDEGGRLRLVVDAVSYEGLVDAAFNQIRQYGRGSAAVTMRLLEAIAVAVVRAQRVEDKAALLRQATMIERGSREGLPEQEDREQVAVRYRAVADLVQRSSTWAQKGWR
jgi:uncharacterized membrane protein